jgi:hypothetical protein
LLAVKQEKNKEMFETGWQLFMPEISLNNAKLSCSMVKAG